MSSLIVNKNKS